MSEDVRTPPWEQEEICGDWSLHPPAPHPVHGRQSMSEHLDARIASFVAEGICPMCKHDLDESGVCDVCAFNANAARRTSWTPEHEDDYTPTIPGALQIPIDEYAPAVLEEEAA